MTYDNDMIRLQWHVGRTLDLMCKTQGIDWPPPEKLELFGETWNRERMSALPDEVAASCPYLARGAEYSQEVD